MLDKSILVRAAPLDDATAAYQRGEYTTTVAILRRLAAQGDASAQFKLGVMLGDPDSQSPATHLAVQLTLPLVG